MDTRLQHSDHRRRSPFRRPRRALAVAALLSTALIAADSRRAGAGDDAVQLTVLSQFGDNPALQNVLDELNETFESNNPGIDVDIEYLTLDDLTRTVPTALASGEGPDVIDYDANESSLGDLARNGLLASLDDYATSYEWTDRLAESALERTTFDGQLFGIGRSSEAVGLFYNADIFATHGIAAPDTYDAFITAADTLAAAGITPIAFGNQDQWPSSHLIGAALHATVPIETITGIETLGGTGSWSDPAVIAAFDTGAGWAASGYLTPDFNAVSFDDALKSFFAGEAGMFIEGTGVIPDIITNMEGVDVRFVPFPMQSGEPQQAEGGIGGAWAITASADAPDAAAAWIDFVHFSDDAEAAWFAAGVLPTTNFDGGSVEVDDLVRDSLDVVAAALDGGGIGYWTGYSSSPLVIDAWNGGAQLLLTGELEAVTFAAQLQDALEQARTAG